MQADPEQVPEELFDDEFDDNFEDQVSPKDEKQPPLRTQKASDARRRLEDYWEEKRLKDQLKGLDDWE